MPSRLPIPVLLTLICLGFCLPSCVQNNPVTGLNVGPGAIVPDSVSIQTGKSRTFEVIVEGALYTGQIDWSSNGGGELLAFPGEGRSRYVGQVGTGNFEIRAILPAEGFQFFATVSITDLGFGFDLGSPFAVSGGNGSQVFAAATVQGNTALFADSSSDPQEVLLRIVDLLSGQVLFERNISGLYGAPLGVAFLGDGSSIGLFAPQGSFDGDLGPFFALAHFGANLSGGEVPIYITDRPARPTVDFENNIYLAESVGVALLGEEEGQEGGTGIFEKVVKIDSNGAVLDQFVFDFPGETVRMFAADSSDRLYVVSSAPNLQLERIRRFSTEGDLLDLEPFFEFTGRIDDIAIDAEGAIYLATTGGDTGTGLLVLNELGDVITTLTEIGVPDGHFIRGDINGDGSVDDIDLAILNDFFAQTTQVLPCAAAADIDDNNEIEPSDAVLLANFLSQTGPPPASPFPECGPNSPFSSIPCDTSSCLTTVQSTIAVGADPFGDPTQANPIVTVEDWDDPIGAGRAAIGIIHTPNTP